MTAFYKTETYDKEHLHFGGVIYPSDFNTDYRTKGNGTESWIASRIEADFKREIKMLNTSKKEKSFL